MGIGTDGGNTARDRYRSRRSVRPAIETLSARLRRLDSSACPMAFLALVGVPDVESLRAVRADRRVRLCDGAVGRGAETDLLRDVRADDRREERPAPAHACEARGLGIAEGTDVADEQLADLPRGHGPQAHDSGGAGADAHVPRGHEPYTVLAAEQEGAEVGGGPDVVDDEERTSSLEQAGEVEAGLFRIGKRWTVAVEVDAQVGDQLDDPGGRASLAGLHPEDLREGVPYTRVVAHLRGQRRLSEPAGAAQSDRGDGVVLRRLTEYGDESFEIFGPVHQAGLRNGYGAVFVRRRRDLGRRSTDGVPEALPHLRVAPFQRRVE
ncbi:hypothetical protein ACVW0K_002515 [Streptomyces filamentosus]